MYDFHESYAAWGRIPVDDFDYLEADDLLTLDLIQFQELLQLAWNARWTGWRNKDNSLVEFMNLDALKGKTVMDFGCGLGLDACQYASHGCPVVLADMHPKLLKVAQQTLACGFGVYAKKLVIVRQQYPYFRYPIDGFWSMGVLHHMPYAGDILRSVLEQLSPGGEARIVLYSDKRWKEMMECEPPLDTPNHPRFQEYVRKCDTVGVYADWYNEEKLKKLVEGFGQVVECKYLCNEQFVGGVIKAKEKKALESSLAT